MNSRFWRWACLGLSLTALSAGCDGLGGGDDSSGGGDDDGGGTAATVKFIVRDGRGELLGEVEIILNDSNSAEASTDSNGEAEVDLADGDIVHLSKSGYATTSYAGSDWSEIEEFDAIVSVDSSGLATVSGDITGASSAIGETAVTGCGTGEWFYAYSGSVALDESPQPYSQTCYAGKNTVYVLPDTIYFDDPEDAFASIDNEVDVEAGDDAADIGLPVSFGGKNLSLTVSGGFESGGSAGYQIFPGAEAGAQRTIGIEGSSGTVDVTVPVNDDLSDMRFWLIAGSTKPDSETGYPNRYSRKEFSYEDFLDADGAQEVTLRDFEMDDVSPANGDTGVSTEPEISWSVGDSGEAQFVELYLFEVQDDGWDRLVWRAWVDIGTTSIQIPEGILSSGKTYHYHVWGLYLDPISFYQNHEVAVSGFWGIEFATE